MRLRFEALGLGGVLGILALLQLLPLGATAADQQASRRVIVLLKNQETGLPATKPDFGRRRAAIQRLQAPIRSQMSASGATSVKSFTVVNAVSATVSQNEASQLKSNPAVREVVPDQVNPGQVATIPVTITPTAASGTKVTGTLFVDDFSAVSLAAFNNPFGNEVVAIPYSYTVK
jgi:hypothetical protein